MEISLSPFVTTPSAVLKLRKARPDIRIFIHGRGAIGGKEGEKLRQEDTEKNWDGGVTTHG